MKEQSISSEAHDILEGAPEASGRTVSQVVTGHRPGAKEKKKSNELGRPPFLCSQTILTDQLVCF